MVDTKKEQEREELHRAIWAIADELRGAVDGWDFKNYVLGTMFYRYISENITAYINSGEIEAGNTEFDYAKMAIKIGVTDYLLKPISSEKLLEAVNKVAEEIRKEQSEKEQMNQYAREMQENKERESGFEIQITVGDKFYAYGFSAILSKRKICLLYTSPSPRDCS